MGNQVTLTIDDQLVTVNSGTFVVDAAKKIGIDIPVFCYHPKMEPVGMCRMCLVEVGRPMMDRTTNQPILEADGKPKIQFLPKLETACTMPVSEGMVVITNSTRVTSARRDVLEFLLTSHPLDCPVCDKGGECPLQNLTLQHGPGQSRFNFDEKIHSAKHVPLGDLIFLDRERCIQCARCVRFQQDVVDDPVLGFYHRGRSLEIATYSEPGFDSIFSGNTTDICPVGALTTADFRFGARPWELTPSASLCNHCSVGCNISFNVRREARSNGNMVIKRVMPRQNENVNEIWICDKGRFGYHYAESPDRLTQPLIRKEGELVPATWDEAYDLITAAMKKAAADMVALVGGRLTNEDLYNLFTLTQKQGGRAVLNSPMAGGDLTSQFGLVAGSNISDMGKGSAILVVACDLHQEAPIWWLRIRQAVNRGASLIIINARPGRLDKDATHVIRCGIGQQADILAAFSQPHNDSQDPNISMAVKAVQSAENVVIFYGSDGLRLAQSQTLALACCDLLRGSAHFGRPNNGLVGVWPDGNTQGAWEVGFHTDSRLAENLSSAKLVYIAAADPAGDDPQLKQALEKVEFILVQELFLTESARMADVVLPVQAYTEREGTYTSNFRLVQRFFPALPPKPGPRPDFMIAAQIGQRLGYDLEGRAPSLVLLRIASDRMAFKGITYQRLAERQDQWPIIGRGDLYYGGTGYENSQGLGIALALLPAQQLETPEPDGRVESESGAIRAVPITILYDRGSLLLHSVLLHPRLEKVAVTLHPDTASALGLEAGLDAEIEADGQSYPVKIKVDGHLPVNTAFVSRSMGVPIDAIQSLTIHRQVTMIPSD